jgi:aryl-alcohol dehydrogenase-like predicted oxidoreductase
LFSDLYSPIDYTSEEIMQINKRALGSSGLEITTVGFGAWAIGGGGWAYGWGRQDDKASENAMRRAIELGINWIDTAAVVGVPEK